MDTHHIHGTEVGFHTDAKEAKDFLRHGVHSDAMHKYLETAKNHGETDFYTPDGDKFKIKHELVEGKDTFTVEKSHH